MVIVFVLGLFIDLWFSRRLGGTSFILLLAIGLIERINHYVRLK